MELIAKVNNKKFVEAYFSLWEGAIGITGTQKKFALAFLEEYRNLQVEKVPLKHLWKLLFSSETYARIRKENGWSNQGFSNYFAIMKEKKIFLTQEDGYIINPKFLPRESITFKFIINE